MPSVGKGWISDFRDTPFQALPASQTSKQDELAGPAGAGSSPSGQHEMGDGQTGYSFAQGAHLLSTNLTQVAAGKEPGT